MSCFSLPRGISRSAPKRSATDSPAQSLARSLAPRMAPWKPNRPASPMPDSLRRGDSPTVDAAASDDGDPMPQRMERGKLKLERIEDKHSRQASFLKRRHGLFKKARELAVLCDVDVALIIFSAKGRLFEYSGGNSLKNMIERRRQICKDEGRGAHESIREVQSVLPEGPGLLQSIQRQLEEGNINKLSIEELELLEQQVDDALGETRSRKTEIMLQTIGSLNEQVKNLRAENELVHAKTTEALNKEVSVDDRPHSSRAMELEFDPEEDGETDDGSGSPGRRLQAMIKFL